MNAPSGKRAKTKHSNGGTLGFEAKLWAAVDALRNDMDAAGVRLLGPGTAMELRSSSPVLAD